MAWRRVTARFRGRDDLGEGSRRGQTLYHPDLTLSQAVLSYRGQYGLEHGFARLKGKPLGLSPMYLQTESRVVGLVHLLSMGLRVLTLVEYVVRRNLSRRARPDDSTVIAEGRLCAKSQVYRVAGRFHDRSGSGAFRSKVPAEQAADRG